MKPRRILIASLTKPLGLQAMKRTMLHRVCIFVTASFLSASAQSNAASFTWSSTTDFSLGTTTNWTPNGNASAGNGDTMLWDSTVPGDLVIVYGATVANYGSSGIAASGLNLNVNSGHTGSLAITTNTNNVSFRLNAITIDSGAGAFTLGGGGAGTLTAALGFSGNPTINLENNSSSAATIASNVAFGVGGGVAKTMAFQGTGDWLVNAPVPFNNPAISISKSGSGNLTLAGNNAYTGGTTLTVGTLNINSATALGATASTFTIAGGTIDNTSAAAITLTNNNAQNWNGDFAFTGTKDLNLGTGAVTMNASRTVTVNGGNLMVGGVIGGSGFELTKAGAGTLTVSGSNTYTGTTTVSGGTLLPTKAAALPGYDSAGKVVFNGGTVGVQIGGSGWTTAEADTLLSNATKTSGALGIDTSNGSLTQWTAFSTANLGSTLGLTKSGANTLILDQTNTYTGTTTINAGLLSINSTSALPGWNTDGKLAVNSGGALTVGNGVSESDVATLLATGSNFKAGSSIGFDTSAGNRTYGTSLADLTNPGQGALGVSKIGANILTLSVSNSFSGGMSIYAGTVNFGNANALGTGTTTFLGAATLQAGVSGTVSNNIAVGSGTIFDSIGNTVTLTGTISGSGGLTKYGSGSLILSGTNTFTGDVGFNAAGSANSGAIRITNSNALGSGSKTIYLNSQNGIKALELDGSGGNISLPASMSFQTSGMFGAGPSSNINGPVLVNLAGNNTINGTITMTSGNGSSRIGSNGGALELAGTITSNITNRGLYLGGTSTGANLVSGTINNGSGNISVIKEDSGTWTLSGNNTYTGATTINGGILVLASTGSIAGSTSMSVAAGAKLNTTAKTSYTLPAAVSFSLDGTAGTCGLIDATGKTIAISGAAVTFNVSGTLSAPVYVLAKYATISGTAAFASATAPVGYTLNYAYNGGTQIALVQASASDYDTWKALYGVTGQPGDDDDADGLSNFKEYAFGLDPESGSSVSPVTVMLNKTNGTFTYTRRSSSGLTYTIYTSTDLTSWNPDPAATQVPGAVGPNNVQPVVVTLSGSKPLSASKLFVRVLAN